MKLRKVNPNKIMVPEVRVTAQFDEELLAQFKSSIKETGQIAPIICCFIDDQYVLVDGLHRVQEALANKQETVDVAVIEGDMVDVLTKNIFLDHLRGKTPVTEMVRVIEVLWKEYQLDSEKIAAKTGMTRDYVEKLQLISMLTPMCRKALDEGRIKVGHAVALTKIKDPVVQETVLGQQLLYNWSVKELEAYINDQLVAAMTLKASPPSIEPTEPYKPTCFFCKQPCEMAQVANPNICQECAGLLLTVHAQTRAELAKEKT